MKTVRPGSLLHTLLPALMAGAGALLLLTPAWSHGGGDETAGEGSAWGLGIAVMPELKAYRDFDDKTELWPVLSFENRWVRLFGPGLEMKLGKAGPLSFGLTAGYARDGYKASDSPVLEGMARRKSSAWLGGRVGLRGEIASLSAEWAGDASGNSKGRKFKLGVEGRFGLGEFGLAPRLSATWYDAKFVQYYYGVEAAEARAGRAAYRPGSTLNTELGLRVDYRLAAGQMLFADLGVTALGRDIKASPLVDRRTLPELRFGYLYRF